MEPVWMPLVPVVRLQAPLSRPRGAHARAKEEPAHTDDKGAVDSAELRARHKSRHGARLLADGRPRECRAHFRSRCVDAGADGVGIVGRCQVVRTVLNSPARARRPKSTFRCVASILFGARARQQHVGHPRCCGPLITNAAIASAAVTSALAVACIGVARRLDFRHSNRPHCGDCCLAPSRCVVRRVDLSAI